MRRIKTSGLFMVGLLVFSLTLAGCQGDTAPEDMSGSDLEELYEYFEDQLDGLQSASSLTIR